jgi:ligand-binding SRPBCC domain-containing protein
MKVYKKETVQHVNASLDECWAFFSSPRNLQKITPENMGFQITDFDNKSVYPGQIIQYKVSPLFGLKLKLKKKAKKAKCKVKDGKLK